MAGSSRTSSRSSWAPEGVHGDLELVLELPAIDRLNLFLKAALFVQQLFHLIRREFLAEPVAHRFILAQQVDDVPTALLDDFLDSLPLVELGLLLQEPDGIARSEEHTSELQSRLHLVCRLLLEKKRTNLELSR